MTAVPKPTPTLKPSQRLRSRRRKPLPPDVRADVLARDGECVIGKLHRQGIIVATRCENEWGGPFLPHLHRLTYGHVREHPGSTRVHSRRWGIAECPGHNLEHAESKHAAEVRAYLLFTEDVR